MGRLKSDDRLIIIASMIISCLIGFYVNLEETILFYKEFKYVNIDFDYINYHYFANATFIKLKNSDTINKMKQYLPSYSTIGFYSNLSSHEFITYCVLQNLLAPILLDKDKPESYEYIIMFLRDKDPDLIALNLKRKIIKSFGSNLYLAIK